MIAIAAPRVDWYSIAPVVTLVAAALIIILFKAIARDRIRTYEPALVVGVLGLAVTAFFLTKQWSVVIDGGPSTALAHMIALDGFSVFVSVIVVISAALMLLLSSDYLVRHGIESRPEYVSLVLLSASGMLMMATANDLIVVFVALEVLSIPLYVLAAYDRRRARSLEAGIKYYVLGAFSSAILLYGVALIYGATGTTSLEGIQSFLATNLLVHDGTLIAGMVLLLVGLGFKVAAVPFHMWTPDVYEGAPSPVTAFMASATKAAGFAALLRVLYTALPSYSVDWRQIVFALAVLTLLGGSIGALLQTDLKRLLAYSSIAHAGYILIGVQAGIPPTAGFIAKLEVFDAAAAAHSYALLIVGVLTSVIAAFFYLKVILTMYAAEDAADAEADAVKTAASRVPVGLPVAAVLVVCTVMTIWIGILPTIVIDFAHDATLII
jgi:NADH-quinone oxidoreductase subunit N